MDLIMHLKLQSMTEFSKSHVIKKTLQFILSISIFSLLFSYSSWFPFFLHSFNHYSSNYYFQFFNYTIDRKFMFLLSNGIVVFIAISSGLISSSPSSTDLPHEFSNKNRDRLRWKPEFSEVNYVDVDHVDMEIEVGSVGSLEKFVVEDQENRSLIVEVEGTEDDEHRLLSTEELNKKCDDFIQRMKEGIWLEHRQLVIEHQQLMMA